MIIYVYKSSRGIYITCISLFQKEQNANVRYDKLYSVDVCGMGKSKVLVSPQ